MFLDYLALVILLLGLTASFYAFIFVHDIPYKIAKARQRPSWGAIIAAGAPLDHGGKTNYFVGGRTRRDFVKQKGGCPTGRPAGGGRGGRSDGKTRREAGRGNRAGWRGR